MDDNPPHTLHTMTTCRLQRACFCQQDLRKGSAIVALVHLVSYIPLFCALSYIRNHPEKAFRLEDEATEVPNGLALLTNVAFGDVITRIVSAILLLVSVAKCNVLLLGLWLVLHFLLTTVEVFVSAGMAAMIRASTHKMWAMGADVIGISLYTGLQGYAFLVVLSHLLDTRETRRSQDAESAATRQVHVIKT